LVQCAAARQAVPLTAGMIVDRSITIRPGRYTLPSPDLTPAITIRGENLTIDFNGAELAGAAIPPPRDYTLQVISDDGVRGWMDGALMTDSWEPHESRVDRTPITGGQRRFKVDYHEAGGFAELRFEIQRR
jgi:hypothetical protein